MWVAGWLVAGDQVGLGGVGCQVAGGKVVLVATGQVVRWAWVAWVARWLVAAYKGRQTRVGWCWLIGGLA